MVKLFVLFEHATGYAIFKIKQFEEVGMYIPKIEAALNDSSLFEGLVKLVSFSPFKSATTALENMTAICEGTLPEQLHIFINTTIRKKTNLLMGVSDPKLGAAIAAALNIKCTHVGVVPELLRGIRTHCPHLMRTKYSAINEKASATAQVGLSHAFSRAQIKFNVHREDNMIIHSIALLDQLDKNLNSFNMRLREWYSHHYPELAKLVPDIVCYAKMVIVIENKNTLNEIKLEKLKKSGVDAEIAAIILDTARSSSGMDISTIDMINIIRFAHRIVSLAEYRSNLGQYLKNKMAVVAPNLATTIGDLLAARLIARAGSLTNLAKMPSSTLLLLGAEKALFRAMRTHSSTPKYGILFNASFVGRAGIHKGRICRCLAAKCSIAARIDCFSDHVTNATSTEVSNLYGQKLREQVESRLRFYETGEVPIKNEIVMEESKQEVERLQLENLQTKRRNQRAEMKEMKKAKREHIKEEEGDNKIYNKKKKKKD